MMANFTRADLRKSVLQHLAVIAAGEEASAEDAALVDAKIASVVGEVRKWGGLDWGEADVQANLLRYSEDFSAAVWAQTDGTDVVAPDSIAAPDGESSGDSIAASATDTDHGWSQVATLTAVDHVLRVWAKAGDKDWVYLSDDTIASCTAYFDLANGLVGTVGAAATATIEQWPDGWYRCSITFSGTAAAHTFKIQSANADGDKDFAGDGATANTYFWGAEVTQASNGSGYLATGAEIAGFDSQVIPDYAQDALRDIVSFRLAPSFGLVARMAELAQTAAAGEGMLRRHVVAKTSYIDTKEELAYLALQATGYIVIGETAPAAALQAAKDCVDYEFARLIKDNVINFTTTAIPDRAMGPLADILTYSLAPRLGRVDPGSAMLFKQRADIAFGDLKAQMAAKVSSKPAYVEYY
jgi:hypothetical protein